ncbi:AAA family ATPase [Desulfonatronum thiodismutans]|uniref:AAA family ATPase n=1 Tax=Desulfonatronum thiodismutans TaxID=159290 RepID=UPI000691D334|nr:AAA family ATPase [Desulfonatronum thiodismutans]
MTAPDHAQVNEHPPTPPFDQREVLEEYVRQLREEGQRGSDYGPSMVDMAIATADSTMANENRALKIRLEKLQKVSTEQRKIIAASQGGQESAGDVFRFVSLSEMPLIPPRMIMPPLLEDDALIQLFGESGAGKTFCASDIANSIASKTPFHGLNIRKSGHVIYQLGEGIGGFRRRARAWEIVRGVDLSTAPISVSTRPIGLIDKGSADTMCRAIDQASAIHGPPVLLVVDTLARNFGAGDESSTKDMNAFVAVMDMIRTRYGCSIMLVHHPGHGDKTRGRGAYSLPAAIDVNLRLEKDADGMIRLEAVKMKEAEIPPPLAFKLASVDLGMVDEDGQPVTSAVLRSVEYTPRCTESKAGNGKNQKTALDALRRIHRPGDRTALDAWRAALRAEGMPAPRAREATQSLIDAGRVYLSNDGGVYATGDD